jgi:hypothetical protein
VNKTRLALLALPALGVLAVASPAIGAGSTAANWQMNEKAGPMKDSSGNGNNSSMMTGVTRNGSVYEFAGKGRVVVPTSASLVPGSRNFTITARIHLTKVADENFVQKNTYSQSGTQIKLETSGKHLHCRVAGNSGVASVWAWGKAPVLLNGYHTISCTKTATSVTLKLDNQSWTQNIAVGTVTTTAPMTVGGKYPCKTDCDYTYGDIDWVTYTYQ